MTYPTPPWTLQGYAIQTLQLIDIERVRSLIPPEFDIVSLLPGKTLGGVYLSLYGSGSVLEYSELIVVAGRVRYSGKTGGWISHIYVDNHDSVAGGREIWGLPKEIAEFTWEKCDHVAWPTANRSTRYHHRVTVRQGENTLCRFSYNHAKFGWQMPLPLTLNDNVLSTLSGNILYFNGDFKSRLGLVASQLEVPPESPFANLGLKQPWLTLDMDKLCLTAGEPQVVGQLNSSLMIQA
ncbi:MAG: acetoacetate decarboxylase family protein [Moorea sp. SIO1G6]|uniref:acetoacetate decarboxylase family protein n=1 Tax=Moorena sp. SIO1G6 TaxID=2607840 RepID=UPI0013C098D0|nr:acetoacetate decarboxylase family protein [Moorena sp. SIO1G6]NET68470.1 acetoacetate decarboxylase family protein [Moorena sp. SIO1G6]